MQYKSQAQKYFRAISFSFLALEMLFSYILFTYVKRSNLHKNENKSKFCQNTLFETENNLKHLLGQDFNFFFCFTSITV